MHSAFTKVPDLEPRGGGRASRGSTTHYSSQNREVRRCGVEGRSQLPLTEQGLTVLVPQWGSSSLSRHSWRRRVPNMRLWE